jgi:hypothetical protein
MISILPEKNLNPSKKLLILNICYCQKKTITLKCSIVYDTTIANLKIIDILIISILPEKNLNPSKNYGC